MKHNNIKRFSTYKGDEDRLKNAAVLGSQGTILQDTEQRHALWNNFADCKNTCKPT